MTPKRLQQIKDGEVVFTAEELITALEQAHKALRFYADQGNYAPQDNHQGPLVYNEDCCGDRAREALK